MCQIFLATSARPTEDELEAAAFSNQDGIGMMAFSKRGDPTFRRGLTLAEAQEYAAAMPFPFAIHFRLGTSGPDIPSLTHPFVIEPHPTLGLRPVVPPARGEETLPLLMHNGVVSNWEAIAAAAGVDRRNGPWSDTRAIAAAVSLTGLDLLDFLDDSRWLVFAPRFQIEKWGTWHKLRAGLETSSAAGISTYWRDYLTDRYGADSWAADGGPDSLCLGSDAL